MSIRIVILGMLVVALLPALLLLLGRGSPVARRRVERFAYRQALVVTPGNGDVVIRYLATTRRWRAWGLAIGLVAATAGSVAQGTVRIDFLAAFAGWFVGALIAEWRLTPVATASRRAASLAPRLLRDHLRPSAVRAVAAMTVVVLALVAAGVALLPHRAVTLLDVLPIVAAAVASLGIPLAVARHVLDRARPLDLAPDLLAADEAVRDRSLHVIAGSVVALLGMVAAYALGPLLALPWDVSRFLGGAGVALLLGGLLAGWLVATSRRRPAPARLTPSATAV